MLNRRIERLEEKNRTTSKVCVVLSGESKKTALNRNKYKLLSSDDIIFIKIVGV